PPPESHKTLTPEQKQLFRRWIAQGAEYQKHWAYVPPVKPSVPAGRNGIDYLVEKRLKEIGLQPSPEADRRTLARRLCFDLIGLPPKPEQVAGDLLSNSGLEQKVGSAFNRLLLTTEEGGAQPKDYEARMLTDRVRAVGTVWLGQTIGCAQCHDHKFDPITSRDFYSLGAF